MTLAELLVAMLILLVGIYAVAKGFPALFQQVQADSDRSAMTRLAERAMNIAKANPDDLPFAIYGYATTGTAPVTYNAIRPDDEPRDPDETDPVINPANSRDDIINVIGEPLTIPAAYTPIGGATAGSSVAAPLGMGPARANLDTDVAEVRVYQLIPLVRTDEPPTLPYDHTAPGTFYIETRPDDAPDHTTLRWHVYLPHEAQFLPGQPPTKLCDEDDPTSPAPPPCILDYAWVDNVTADAGKFKPQFYVQRETVTHQGTVLPAGPTANVNFAGLVPEECRAWLRVEFAFGDATATATGVGYVSTANPVPAAGTFYLEYNYGATLLFNAADAGRPVFVDYTLRTGSTGSTKDDSRRELMVFEDEQVPAVNQGPPYSVKLAIGGINDTDPLFADAVDGTNLAGQPVHLLMVDLTDGRTYTDADSPATLDNLDYVNSAVTLNATTAADCLGHRCRFYYRTMDQHTLHVTKAPSTFLPNTVAALYTGAAAADVLYRTYTPSTQTIAGTSLRTLLTFPESSAGQTVSVDYTYGGNPTATPPVLPLRATGELHVIHEESCQIALDNPDVVSIIAVRGASVKARGWWRAQKGKLRHIDVDSCLLRL